MMSTSVRNRRWLPWTIGVAVVLAIAAAMWIATHRPGRAGSAVNGKFYNVQPAQLDVKVVKDGELQAVKNIDIPSLVEGASTIVQIVKEGSVVKKGDVLVVLDSSTIRQKLDDTSLELRKAEADVTNSTEMLQIQEGQNAANLDAAEVDLKLAQLALKQYVEGSYPQQLADAETKLKMAEITLKNKEEDLEQTRSLFTKGFVTAAEVKAGELSVTTVRNELRQAQTALKVLTDYSHAMDLAGKQNYLAQSQQKLARVKQENASNLAQKKADRSAKGQLLVIQQRKYDHLKEQLDFCTIKATADGMVVYASMDRYGNMQNAIAEGTQVRERQQLLRLPDTTSMKAVLRVNESQRARLRLGLTAIVTVSATRERVEAKLTQISPVADSSQRFWNPDAKEWPIELTLDRTPPDLKPGESVMGEILVDRLDDVQAVPLQALYSDRADSYVFVRDGGSVKPHRVTVGESNDTHAQILQGVAAGEQVLMLQPGQGRELLERFGLTADADANATKRDRPRKAEAPTPVAQRDVDSAAH